MPIFNYTVILLLKVRSTLVGKRPWNHSRPSVHPSVSLSVRPSVFFSVCLSVCLSVSLSVCLYVYEITLVRRSVRLSVRPSLSFLKIGSLVFSNIVYYDSWPWYLVTDEARFLKNKIWRPEFRPIGQMGQNRARN